MKRHHPAFRSGARAIACALVVAATAALSGGCRKLSADPPSPLPAAGTPAAAAVKAPPASSAVTKAFTASAVAAKPGPKPVRPPATPAFDHKSHVARGPTCVDCHEGAESKDQAGMPTIEQCMECHEEIEEKAPPEKKIANFVDKATKLPLWNRFAKQAAYVTFSHKVHVGKQVPCADCHGKMEESVRTGPEQHMGMDACTTCHKKKGATEECAPCHATVGTGARPSSHDPKWKGAHGAVVKSGVVSGPADDCSLCHTQKQCADCHVVTRPANHDAAWQGKHGAIVKRGTYDGPGETCMMCHTEPSCSDCHKTTPPANHGRLWMPRHGQVVRRGSHDGQGETCSMCHTETTCISCHRDEKPRDHTTAWLVGPGHGLAASMDRERCSTCHQKDSCVECHTTNPPRSHNSSWGSPRNRHCLGCHDAPAPIGWGGCFACHNGVPSHSAAPPKPAGHRSDWECLLCHDDLKHPVNGQNCNECHR